LSVSSIRAFLRRRISREEAVGLSFTLSFVACAVLAFAVGRLAHEILEAGGKPGTFDVRISEFLIGLRSKRLTGFMATASAFGDHRFLLIATPAVLLTLWASGRHVSALLFAGSVVGGFGLSTVLKIAIARARPEAWKALVTEKSYSFPSGHALMSTVFFGGLAAVVFHLSKSPARRGLAVLVASGVVLTIAASRVYLGAHWPTDTLAGMAAGLIWVLIYASATETVTHVQRRRKALRESGRPG
jgi:membrane-associated phospholipid phosphatase